MVIGRASSRSTNASNRSDLPPETRNRARVAATWLGCSASTRSPASNSRSTSGAAWAAGSRPSPTFNRTSCRHNGRGPLLVVRERGREQFLARLVGDQHVVLVRPPGRPRHNSHR